jgi:uncharacterized protein
LAKRYVLEAGSVNVRRALKSGLVATSRLSAVEVASALGRREREGAFTAAERDRGVNSLNADLTAWILVELTVKLAGDAQVLLVRHGLRSGDAVQLASCLYLQREVGQRISFAAFDDRLNAAARLEGLSLLSHS